MLRSVAGRGLKLSRGESDEWVSYDDDNFLVGERVSVRRAKELSLDEITVTRGATGLLAPPNLTRRWDGLKNPNDTQFYGGWNPDRMQSGRPVVANATIPIYGSLSGSMDLTQALDAPYAVPINRRFDAVISYNVLNTLRRTGIF